MKDPQKSSATALDKLGRKARIGDVAASAGVSVGTVSNVINGRGNVSAKRKALVEKAIKDLSFSGSLLAKGMRSQRFPVVGLCVPNATSSNFVTMSDAIEADAAAAGFELVQVITRHDPARELGRVERLIASRASGVMLLPSAEADLLIERLQAAKMPMVAINHFAGVSTVDHVYVDHRAAFREAACRLAKGGYDEFVVVSQFPTFAVVQENIAGLHEGIVESGRNVSLSTLEAGSTQETYQKALEKALANHKIKRIAVIASSDLLAAWSIEAFRTLEIGFPDEIGLLCAEEPRWARATWPMLSCIQQPTAELAQVAWDMLSARMDGSERPPKTYCCTPNVNFRQSLRLQDS